MLKIPSFPVMRYGVGVPARFGDDSPDEATERKRIAMLDRCPSEALPGELVGALEEHFSKLTFAICQRLVVKFPLEDLKTQRTLLKNLAQQVLSHQGLADQLSPVLLDALADSMGAHKYIDPKAGNERKLRDLCGMSALRQDNAELDHLALARAAKHHADQERFNLSAMAEDMLLHILAIDPSAESAQEIRDIFNGVGDNIPERYIPGRKLQNRLDQMLD